MRYRHILLVLMAGLFLFIVSCSEDIGINDFKYQCNTDNDCQSGYVCDKVKGCVKAQRDAGVDAQGDVSTDVASDILDIGDVLDVEDVGDIQDILDVGDVEDVGDITDIGDDVGVDVSVSYILRLESVYDSSAGVCTSPNYVLESVTGFTSRDEMKSNSYILRGSMLFSK